MTTPEEEEEKRRALDALLGGAPFDPGPLGGLDTSFAPAPVPEVDTAAFETFAGRDPVLADPWGAEELQAQADAAQRRGGATALPTDMPLTGAEDLPEDLQPPPGTTLEVPETDGGGPMVRQAVKRSPAYNALVGGPPVDPGPLDALETELEPVEGTTADVAEDAAEGAPEGSPADAVEDAAEDPEMAEIRALAPNASAPDEAPPEGADELDPIQIFREFMKQAQEGGGQDAGLDIPPPPMVGGGGTEERPAWPIIAAMFLDVAANKGRGLPQLGATALAGRGGGAPGGDAAYENYKRQRQYALDKAGGRRGIVTPLDAAKFAMEAKREGRLTDQYKDLQEYRKDTVGLRERAEDRNTNPQSDYAQAAREVLIANGVPEADVEGLSSEQMKQNFPAFKAKIEYAQKGLTAATAGEEAGARARATFPTDLALVEAGARAREQVAWESPEVRARVSREFTKDTDEYRNVARNISRIEQVVAKYPPGDLPGIGIGYGRIPDAAYALKGERDPIELRNAQRSMNDMVLRIRTGAAAPASEQQMIAMETGARPDATEAEFRIALQAMSEYARGNLRAAAVGRDEAAREVLKAQGLDTWVFGEEPAPAAAPPAAAPPAAPPARRPAPKPAPKPAAPETTTGYIRVRVNGQIKGFRGTREEAEAEGYEVIE